LVALVGVSALSPPVFFFFFFLTCNCGLVYSLDFVRNNEYKSV